MMLKMKKAICVFFRHSLSIVNGPLIIPEKEKAGRVTLNDFDFVKVREKAHNRIALGGRKRIVWKGDACAEEGYR